MVTANNLTFLCKMSKRPTQDERARAYRLREKEKVKSLEENLAQAEAIINKAFERRIVGTEMYARGRSDVPNG